MPARLLIILLACMAAAACSPLKTFNALLPKDGASKQVADDIAYGPLNRQNLDVYAPRELASGNSRPVIIFFYGGSWNSGTRTGYDFVGRALAARGYVVVIPDYRLVPEVRFPAFVEDGAVAVRWARANAAEFGGDPDRIVLAGHSAGAHIAAMLALDEQWLEDDRAAVSGFVGLAGPYDFLPLEGEVTQAAFGAWSDPADTQPITFAGRGDPPALLLTGAKDETVLPRNSRLLAEKLSASGVAARYREYEDVGHVGIVTAIARPLRGNAPVVEDIAAFAAEVTGQ